ncbi:endo-1,3-beta glucanase [Rhizina undulata]
MASAIIRTVLRFFCLFLAITSALAIIIPNSNSAVNLQPLPIRIEDLHPLLQLVVRRLQNIPIPESTVRIAGAYIEVTQTIVVTNTEHREHPPISFEDYHPPAMANIFAAPISTDPPLSIFPHRPQHPVPIKGIVGNENQPMQTNKFYSNLILGEQKQGVWSNPFMGWMVKDDKNFGFAISHVEPSQFAGGPDQAADPIQYYFGPLGIKSWIISSTEHNITSSSVTLDSPEMFSIDLNMHANLAAYGSDRKKITIPLVQGMGFVTAEYTQLTPRLDTGVFILSMQTMKPPRAGMTKLKVLLEDRRYWVIYALPAPGYPSLEWKLGGNSTLVATAEWSGIVQVSKLPNGAGEDLLDSTAGAYPVLIDLEGTVSGSTGSYTFNFRTSGQNNAGAPLMYALPHQVATFDAATQAGMTSLRLSSITKGVMTGVIRNQWTMSHTDLPTNVGLLANLERVTGNAAAMKIISEVNAREITNTDVASESNLDSMYFSGKALAKYAGILAVSLGTGNDTVSKTGLAKLETAISRFTENRQIYPLVYDDTWRGLVSDATYRTGDNGRDFGNALYNDHHFHYAYYVYAASVIATAEKQLYNSNAWLNANKAWVDSLVRDVANPSPKDPYFPVSRAFDWWHGHSWAKGLFESGDGKDQESSSEDINYAYAQKLWGEVTGNVNMVARANLMLAVMKSSFNSYFLLASDNVNHPSNFIKNKVTGILFENKVDHATYFGLNPEYIQGIHMLPLTPMSAYYRSSRFCAEEWQQWFDGRTSGINDGWKGILYANVALFNPKESWKFFIQPGWRDAWLDSGASRSFYLALAAGLGGTE